VKTFNLSIHQPEIEIEEAGASILMALALMPRAIDLSGKRNCVKGFPCGATCIARNRQCRNPLQGQYRTAADWVQANSSTTPPEPGGSNASLPDLVQRALETDDWTDVITAYDQVYVAAEQWAQERGEPFEPRSDSLAEVDPVTSILIRQNQGFSNPPRIVEESDFDDLLSNASDDDQVLFRSNGHAESTRSMSLDEFESGELVAEYGSSGGGIYTYGSGARNRNDLANAEFEAITNAGEAEEYLRMFIPSTARFQSPEQNRQLVQRITESLDRYRQNQPNANTGRLLDDVGETGLSGRISLMAGFDGLDAGDGNKILFNRGAAVVNRVRI
jgi:hypothetical protein